MRAWHLRITPILFVLSRYGQDFHNQRRKPVFNGRLPRLRRRLNGLGPLLLFSRS